MAISRREQGMLGALAVVVVGAALYWVSAGSSPTPASAPARRPAAGGRGAASQSQPTQAPAVHLNALDGDRPEPVAGSRDLFRFKPKAPPPPPPKSVAAAPNPAAAAPAGPPPPPPPPPIPFKFIGTVEQGTGRRLAVLSDGRGVPVYGREGDIIEGRYRIVRIGAESIELEHIDGKGRQTIRLTGS
jgi:hypothetical protein